MDYKICFEIAGLAEDAQGNPAAAGGCIDMVGTGKKLSLEELQATVNISGILKLAGLDSFVQPEAVRLISEEEYEERYGMDD